MEKFNEIKEFLLERKYFLIIGGIIILSIIGIFFFLSNYNSKEEIVLENEIVEEENKVIEEKNCNIKVDIKGEVQKPGLYELKCEDRVLDVINLAGGLTKKADTSVLNLGKKVIDEMVIVVLSHEQINSYKEEIKKIEEKIEKCGDEIKNDACINNENIYVSENKSDINIENSSTDSNVNDNEIIGDTPVNSLVSINKASLEELMTLSGIGKSKAESIIKYRNENGGFKTLEELKNVKGIGDSIFEKIKGNITL